MYQDFFRGKRVTLMGLGLLGRGIGDARFLAQMGAMLLITDLKSETELAPSLKELEAFPNITYHLGGHREEDFVNTDMVVYAAGVPKNSPYLAAARAKNIPLYMSTALFAKFAKEVGAVVVGVTGTRGKSTVSAMIHHCLPGSIVGGNIRGKSTLELLPNIQKGDTVILELDSWQLQGFGALCLSPDVSVFTNLMQDHLNYYASMDEYFADKANIFKFQKELKIVAGGAIAPKIPRAIVPGTYEWNLKIPGEHNKENASLAAEALKLLGLTDEQIKSGLESFEGVEGRLQFVQEVRGVKIFNDNNATTPEATIAALDALGTMRTILIMGGADKGLDMSALEARLPQLKKVVRIEQGLTKALDEALAAASPGDIILFSPAFASFGMFKNEYDRNDQFLAAVKNLA